MICTHINSCIAIEGAFPKMKPAFDFIRTLTPDTPDGTYELDGRNIYAMVQSYDTEVVAPERMEVHRKYIDIQYTISGTEVLAWCHDDGTIPALEAYSDTKDVTFLAAPADKELSRLEMAPGKLAVFFPTDAHWGKCIAKCGPKHVKKVCIKVAAEYAK